MMRGRLPGASTFLSQSWSHLPNLSYSPVGQEIHLPSNVSHCSSLGKQRTVRSELAYSSQCPCTNMIYCHMQRLSYSTMKCPARLHHTFRQYLAGSSILTTVVKFIQSRIPSRPSLCQDVRWASASRYHEAIIVSCWPAISATQGSHVLCAAWLCPPQIMTEAGCVCSN